MKKITIMVPYSWTDEMINKVKEKYERDGYVVYVMGIPG